MITYFSNIDMILYVLVYVIWYNHLCNITILIPQLQPAKIFCCNDFLPRKICVWIVFLQTAEKDTAVCGLGQWINRLRARDGFWVSVQECLSSYGEKNGPYRPYRLQRLASLSLRDIEGHVKGHHVRLVKEFLPGSGASRVMDQPQNGWLNTKMRSHLWFRGYRSFDS